jgi:hypothetical protein
VILFSYNVLTSAVIFDVRKFIETLNHKYANRAQNRTAICTPNRTRVDGP